MCVEIFVIPHVNEIGGNHLFIIKTHAMQHPTHAIMGTFFVWVQVWCDPCYTLTMKGMTSRLSNHQGEGDEIEQAY